MVTQTFNVAAAPLIAQSISFISPGNQTLGTAPAALVATASSGLPVSLASTTPGVCTASGTTLTLLAVGSCTISASQAGDSTYASAAPVSNTFSVAAAPLTAQTITFASPGNQTIGTAPPALVATSSSGLAVALDSTTTPVCTVVGSTLTLVSAGSCTIVASQAGNSTFSAAMMVSNTFSVAAAPVGPNAFANGGFETAANGAGEFADGWQTQTGVTRSSAEAHSGSFSALMTITNGNPGGTGLFQNSVDHGQLANVSAANWGTAPTLTFWVRGNPSETGDLNYALRYLAAGGAILNTGSSQARTIWTGNTDRGWTQITLAGITIPNNTTAVFLEMTLAAGPSGTFPGCGPTGSICVWGTPAVFLDDVSLPLLP
ncbi:MAG: hypothetical protein Q8R33_00940 [Burkholderiales bacterium]|nr:hypothetical protein [Burkholderiales bacterium]